MTRNISVLVSVLFSKNVLADSPDCTNSRAYATVLRPSACRLSVCDVCLVAKRCVQEQKLPLSFDSLQEVVHEESIAIEMNDLDLCLEVV